MILFVSGRLAARLLAIFSAGALPIDQAELVEIGANEFFAADVVPVVEAAKRHRHLGEGDDGELYGGNEKPERIVGQLLHGSGASA